MAGFGMMLAGAAAGLGESLVEKAKSEREMALERIKRQWRQEDAALDHQRSMDQLAMGNQYDIDAENRRNKRTDQLSADAANAFANGNPGRAGEAMTYLMEKHGMPEHIAAGFVGNTMQESGVGLNSTAVGDNGNAFGTIQHNGPRRRALFAWAEQNGRDVNDWRTQFDFAVHELQTSEAAAWEKALQTNTAEEAAEVLSESFWRPGVPHLQNRKAYAAKLYGIMSNPDHTPETRKMAADKLAEIGEAPAAKPKSLTGYEWVDMGDGTEKKVAYNNGRQVEVTDLAGNPVTRPTDSPWKELKASQINEIEEDLEDSLGEIDARLANSFSAEIERIMNEDKMSFAQAKAKAFETAEREQITTRQGGFLGIGGEDVTTEGEYTGRFNRESDDSAAPEVGDTPGGLRPPQQAEAIPEFKSETEIKSALRAGEIADGQVVILNGRKVTVRKGKPS